MTIEQARAHAVPKPWGSLDVRPWRNERPDGSRIGEIWFERSNPGAKDPSLLLKLLFTEQPLSIQVHPDDACAHSLRLANGKTEAWYVLSAVPDAKVALGLSRRVTLPELRQAIKNGAISELVKWCKVLEGDTVFVPAGTIHAIGAGIVIAEIQQRSDATFRLFDYGRERELHIEGALAVADAGPAAVQGHPRRLSNERTLLVTNEHFVFEKIRLTPNSGWCMEAEGETWLLILEGNARVGSFDLGRGDAVFAQSDHVIIRPGPAGMVGLVAYTGSTPASDLLRPLKQTDAIDSTLQKEVQMPFIASAKTSNGQLGMTR